MPRYKHPPAFKVVKYAAKLGPYHEGKTFNAEELRPIDGEQYIEEGLLIAVDAFGDPIVHVPDAEPFEEPVEEVPAPAAKSAKKK